MKLDEFVKQTLLDITNGVVNAQQEALLYVAPGFVENEKVVESQLVKFEVAVTVNQEAGAGIQVFSFGNAKTSVQSENLGLFGVSACCPKDILMYTTHIM